ncbi:MAG: RIP metalloprotease RseP [Acidobacteria bacterium]|nr:RIP metalloprotease RseP [Acidobacteriota bacterium]
MELISQVTNWTSSVVTNVLSLVVVLGVVIFVHEAGHLLVAKLFGVRVETFSLGFGRRLWGFKRGGTDYRVSLIPLGGYVKMSGELPGEGSSDPADFTNKPRWQRFLVYLAGPAMNAVLSVTLIALVFMWGISVPATQALPARVGLVQEGSSAAAAGIVPGDRIVEVDGDPMAQWDDVQVLLMTAARDRVKLLIERGEQQFTATVTPQPIPETSLRDTAGIFPEQRLNVTFVESGSPAAAAGFKSGDRLEATDGIPVTSPQKFIEYVSQHPGQPIKVSVLRDGQELVLPVTPRDEGGSGKIGVGIGAYQKYSPGRAFVESVRFNLGIVKQTVLVVQKIFTRRVSAESALSGPIEIARISGSAARVGLPDLIYLMGFISISIGFLNLLPIPVLDGGQMMLLTIEGVIRRDLPMRAKDLINQVGFVLVMLLMVMVLFFDLKKNIPSGLLPGP